MCVCANQITEGTHSENYSIFLAFCPLVLSENIIIRSILYVLQSHISTDHESLDSQIRELSNHIGFKF
jgi:hypothetical protein